MKRTITYKHTPVSFGAEITETWEHPEWDPSTTTVQIVMGRTPEDGLMFMSIKRADGTWSTPATVTAPERFTGARWPRTTKEFESVVAAWNAAGEESMKKEDYR